MSRYDNLRERLAGDPASWLVTGAAGFIGSALVEELLALGQTVVGLDNFSTGHAHNVESVRAGAGEHGARYTFIEGDICDVQTCHRAASGTRYVLHQAALGSVPRSIEDPQSTHRSNVDGFLNMLIAARDAGAERFVYASSSSVYGDHPALPKVEDTIGRALSPYAVSKRINELYADVFGLSYQTAAVGLRYFNVFGPRQDPAGAYAAVIPKWLDRMFAGSDCVVFGDGETSRDFCFIANVVQANLLAATTEGVAAGAVFNVGCGGNTTLNRLFELLRESAATHDGAVASVGRRHEDERAGDVRHSQADVSALVKTLGYEPTHDVAAGIAETVAWYAAAAKL